ncbi:MAG: hypothetical protein Kow0063_10740 [Anaerolineae bacterium]
MKLKTLCLTSLVVLAALGTALALAYSTLWQLAIFAALPCLVSLLGIILALAGLIAWLRTRTKETPGLSRGRKGLLLVGLFLSLQAAYLPIAQGLRDLEVRRAQDFINVLIPRLEEYKRLHDTYPDTADLVLTGDEQVPRLLQLNGDFPMEYDNRHYYARQGATYGFQFYLPDGFIGFQYEYCCGADGVWMVTD